MVKQDIIERKLGQIEKSLCKIRPYKVLSYAEFISHVVARDVMLIKIFLAVYGCTGIFYWV